MAYESPEWMAGPLNLLVELLRRQYAAEWITLANIYRNNHDRKSHHLLLSLKERCEFPQRREAKGR